MVTFSLPLFLSPLSLYLSSCICVCLCVCVYVCLLDVCVMKEDKIQAQKVHGKVLNVIMAEMV